MEKLIELLNEYEKERGTNRVCHGVDIGIVMSEGITYRFSYVISKEFGFIKWLVDNDKIDLEKAHYKFEGTTVLKNCIRGEYGRYKWLLMLLSISDTPIEDLISYLKIS